ncbi:MAG: hypothetical protein V4580_05880 [Bacteroidota bacterium]
MRSFTLILFFLVTLVSCKKNVEPEKENRTCSLFTSLSSDTNYIPHKKNNYWQYCYEGSYVAWSGWSAVITCDTVISGKAYFSRTFSFTAGHSGGGAGSALIGDSSSYYSMIDNSGKYYYLKYRYQNPSHIRDSIMIINPFALNGDTIYNNSLAGIKVVVINKNETFYSIAGCYHSRVILSANSGITKIVDHYFRKGLGEIYFTENISEKKGEILSMATIH